MRMQIQAEKALKTLRSMGTKRTAMTIERDIVVLWGIFRRWSNAGIAKMAGAGVKTIRRRKMFFTATPEAIFSLEVLYKGQRGFYRCEFCGEAMVKIPEQKAREHVAYHVVTMEAIRMNGVM